MRKEIRASSPRLKSGASARKNSVTMKDFDDKDLVIISATLIAIFSMYLITEAKDIVLSVVSGLMGIAVGKSLSK